MARRGERRARRGRTVEREAAGALATAGASEAGRAEVDTAQPVDPVDANVTEPGALAAMTDTSALPSDSVPAAASGELPAADSGATGGRAASAPAEPATERVLSPERAAERVAERRTVAAARPIPAPGVTPAALAETRAAIHTTMAAYASAIETRDIAAVRAAHPGLTREQQKAWEEFFASVRALKARLTVEQVSLAGPVAQASVRGVYEYENVTRGVPERAPVRFRAVFTRDTTGWRLTSIR